VGASNTNATKKDNPIATLRPPFHMQNNATASYSLSTNTTWPPNSCSSNSSPQVEIYLFLDYKKSLVLQKALRLSLRIVKLQHKPKILCLLLVSLVSSKTKIISPAWRNPCTEKSQKLTTCVDHQMFLITNLLTSTNKSTGKSNPVLSKSGQLKRHLKTCAVKWLWTILREPVSSCH